MMNNALQQLPEQTPRRCRWLSGPLWQRCLMLTICLLLILTSGQLVLGQQQDDATDGVAADEERPRHAIAKATAEEKALYETVKQTVARYNASDVARSAGQRGFCDEVGAHYAPYLETCVWGWRYSGDERWLERFVEMMTALEAALTENPDGAKGWHSEVDVRRWGIPWPTRWQPGLVTASQWAEARIGAAVAEFALATREGSVDFRVKYNIPAGRWVKLFEEELMPKWDKMGCFQTLSDDRGIYCYPHMAFDPQAKQWRDYPQRPGKDNITLPHPYQSDIIRQYLKLWQVTGKGQHRQRAEQLLMWQKSCLRPGKHDSYWWNFFDPAGDHDFRSEGGLVFGQYLHPDVMYPARDVEAFVEAYHAGVVIDSDDLKRLVNTQLRIMLIPNDDPKQVGWKFPNGQPGRGTVWPALAEFDDKIEAITWAQMNGRNLEFGSPLRFLQEKLSWGGWERRNVGDASVIEWKKTYKDYKREMEDLLRAHPEPDPLGRR